MTNPQDIQKSYTFALYIESIAYIPTLMAKKKDNIDFDIAFEQLKQIMYKIQTEDTGIEALSKYVDQANVLLEQCKNRLRQIEESMNNDENK